MKHLALLFALALGLSLAPRAEAQTASDAQRFDVQAFRPSGNPYDLVMVRQSTPMPQELFVSGGLVLDFALDPLVLIRQDSQKKLLSVVGNRLELNAVATVGLLDWLEVGLAMPLVLAQTSDNLESLGTEGPIQSLAQGDLRFDAKLAIPGLKRELTGSGLGAALTFGLSLPTGVRDAFASDGTATWSPGFVLDYRFGSGILLAVNGGYWSRPVREFNGLKLGPMATFGGAAELPIVGAWNISAVGEVYGSATMVTELDGKHAVPAEALLALRWYSPSGLTFTVGGGGGCGCSFSAPTLRLFASIIWEPHKTKKYAGRFKEPPPPPPPNPDPDGDGVIGEKDKCPDKAGPVENSGCPDTDRDHDGVVDRLDKCPDLAQRSGHDGCPLARVDAGKILILDPIHFLTDSDIIENESRGILDDVARVLQENPDILRVRIEGHTDSRHTNKVSQDNKNSKDNLELSRLRANAVARYLIEHGISPKRLVSVGYGSQRRLLNDDDHNEEAMARNRRIEFAIERRAAEQAAPPTPEQVQQAQAASDAKRAQEEAALKEAERLRNEQKARAEAEAKEAKEAREAEAQKRAKADKSKAAEQQTDVKNASAVTTGDVKVTGGKDGNPPADPVERKRWRLTPRPLSPTTPPVAAPTTP